MGTQLARVQCVQSKIMFVCFCCFCFFNRYNLPFFVNGTWDFFYFQSKDTLHIIILSVVFNPSIYI